MYTEKVTPEQFVKKIYSAYTKNIGIFANKVNAEELIPKSTTNLQKALYLFYVIQLDYATKSQRLYQGAHKLFKEHPKFFTPQYIVTQSEKELEKILKEYLKPRYINEAVKRYKLNSKQLIETYQGNPQNIFRESKTALTALKKVCHFRGFGPKIGNFFARTMINTFNYIYPDIENMLPPVDMHDVRTAYLMGFIDSCEMTKKNITKVKNLWNTACREAGVNWLVVDKALWLLGSEGKPKTKEDICNMLQF
jgi:N-glycosylase/DNA lyase